MRGRRGTIRKPEDSVSPPQKQPSPTKEMENPVETSPDKSPIRDLVALKDVRPDEWKNIALPLVDAIKALLSQVGNLTQM